MHRNFGDYVRLRLREVNISQAEAARKGGFSRQALAKWLRGEVRRIELQNIFSLAQVLNVAPYYLLQRVCSDLGVSMSSPTTSLRTGDHASFVEDVTIPDNTPVHTGQVFTKVWRLQNTGTEPWVDRHFCCCDTQEGRLDGLSTAHLFTANTSIPIPRVAPGDTVDLTVVFKAPDLPGTVRSTWKILDSNGDFCFADHKGVWCQVRVISI